MTTDYYKTLNVNKNASFEEIKASYRNLAKVKHPDKGGTKEEFQKIQTAYETLSDENKRREYDNPNSFPNFMNNPHPFQNFNVNINPGQQQGFPFGNIFHFMNGNNANPSKKPDEVYKCPISLKEVYFGTSRKFHISRKARCEKCNIECNQCSGTGFDKNGQRVQIGPFMHVQNQMCNLCTGEGYKKLPFCEDCKNVGFKSKEFDIEVIVPKGVENGKTYTYEGLGEQGIKKNEISGNFIFIVDLVDDPFFKRRGLDLVHEVKISFKESIIGRDLTVPFFEENIKVDIRQFCVIRPGKEQIIKSKGLRNEIGDKGNLILKFDVVYPKKNLTLGEIEQLEKVFESINF